MNLVGEDLDGNPVSLSTTTDADGKYSFDGLASGTYKVTFDPNGLTSNSIFAPQNAGGDDTADSDGDTTTGEAAEFTLAPDSSDPSWDQGLIIDRSIDVTIDKKIVDQTAPDKDNKVKMTYELVVENTGMGEETYDLADNLKFGGDIKIDSMKASNTKPGGIAIDPAFDGITNRTLVEDQKIAGGETHTYEVVVEATVSTKITSAERDCKLTKSEKGTGFLNEAELTVEDQTVTDTACGEVPPPPVVPDEPSLPNTGGPALWLGLVGLLAVIGGAFVVARRRNEEVGQPRHLS